MKGEYTNMELIQGGKGKQVFPDYEAIYFRVFMENFGRYSMADGRQRHDYAVRMVWAGVKYLVRVSFSRRNLENSGADILYSIHETVVQAIQEEIPPAELARMFPAVKEYDGEKREVKDYFYSTRAVQEAGGWMKFPNREQILSFIWEYHNWDISLFTIAGMNLVDEYREARGEKPCIEAFLSEQTGEDVRLAREFHIEKDKAGRSWIYDDEGNCVGREKRKRVPRWMKCLEGGAAHA